ncbi:MAG: CDP-glycerol glycerophosphotransferase family protein [Nitrospirota bacterium]
MLERVVNFLAYLMSGLAPRRPGRVVCGAWMGRRYADNPRYLFEYLCREQPGLDVRWVGSSDQFAQIPEEFRNRFVRWGSLSALWSVLTAERVYISHGYHDLAKYNLCRGAVVTYLGHGLTIKRMGSAPQPVHGLVGRARKVLGSANTFDAFAVSSREHANKLLAEYSGNGIAPDRLVYLGQPRTDPLLATDRDERGRMIRRTILERHGVPGDRRMVTYMPTFRDAGTAPFSFLRLDGEPAKAVEEVLARHDAVLIEKVHFVDGVQRATSKAGTNRRIIGLGSAASLDTQDLLLATDLLITDYSGVYLDYLHLDRPVLHFAYDLEFYANADRGMYYSLDKVAGGPVAENLDDLLRHLDMNLANPARERERRKALREWFLDCDDGRSCERFASELEKLSRA